MAACLPGRGVSALTGFGAAGPEAERAPARVVESGGGRTKRKLALAPGAPAAPRRCAALGRFPQLSFARPPPPAPRRSPQLAGDNPVYRLGQPVRQLLRVWLHVGAFRVIVFLWLLPLATGRAADRGVELGKIDFVGRVGEQ